MPLSCQLEFGAVSGKARSMEALVQCWVGTALVDIARNELGLICRTETRTRIRSFQKELNHLCAECELKSRKKTLFLK